MLPDPVIRLKRFSCLLLLPFLSLISAAGLAADSKGAAADTPGETRVAVVIGNSAYPSSSLPNPRNDATAVAAALKKLGFDVDLKINASKADMDALFKRFSAKADKATTAAVFYAGHGIQVGGQNYLVPIDANPTSERDLKREMVKLDDVIDDLGSAKVKLVFFDACRDNPLARSFSRGSSRGLSAPSEGTGTLISFATKHGNTASDGEGEHSPYTQALLLEIEASEGVEIEQLLRKVQQSVKKITQGQQEPWRYGSLDGDFYFRAALPAQPDSKAQQEAINRAIEEATRKAEEKATRDKAELQQSLKAQQETANRAAQEANQLAAQQAAREKAELQQSLKTQQEGADRAIQAALRGANEQAAREKAELQQAMDKMLREALAKQNAQLEEERLAKQKASGGTGAAPVVAAPPSLPGAAAIPVKPLQIASIAPLPTGSTPPLSAAALASLATAAPGDEWEYLATDNRFGKKTEFTQKISAVVPGTGVLEKRYVNGKETGEWVFAGKPMMIGLPTESEVMFSPYWDGSNLDSMTLLNWPRCLNDACTVKAELAGQETISTKAGTFDTKKIVIGVNIRRPQQPVYSVYLKITAWYSDQHRRVVRQQTDGAGAVNQFRVDETIELVSVRSGSAAN